MQQLCLLDMYICCYIDPDKGVETKADHHSGKLKK
jgi:hypothetical protein